MRFIMDSSMSTKMDKIEEMQEWLVEHQAELAASYPKGISLIGCFVTVLGGTKGVGDFHMLEQLDSYGALDASAAEARKPDSEYRRLSMELMEFVDFSREAPASQTLLKDVLDATVMNTPSEAKAEAVPV